MPEKFFPEIDFKKDFPFLNRQVDNMDIVYLDSAATSLKPRPVIDAISHYYSNVSTNVHRGKSYVTEEASNVYEQTRYKVADLLRCSGNEIVFCKNTTEAINIVSQGLDYQPNDWVLICSDAHHSNFLPWQQNTRTQCVGLREDGTLDLDEYYRLLKDKPALVAITHCSNVTGLYLPITEMATAAKEHGALVLLDAAQSAPHTALDVRALQVDFLALSAHKMLGPTGLGILYGRQEALEKLKPHQWGGGMVDWVSIEETRKRKIPHRFEAGTPNISGVFGFGAALDYLKQLGMENIAQYDLFLSQYILDRFKMVDGLRLIGPEEGSRSAVISFAIEGMKELDDLSRMLSDSYGIICRTGHLCAQPLVNAMTDGQVMRVSGYMYTSTKDIDYFFNSLAELINYTLNR